MFCTSVLEIWACEVGRVVEVAVVLVVLGLMVIAIAVVGGVVVAEVVSVGFVVDVVVGEWAVVAVVLADFVQEKDKSDKVADKKKSGVLEKSVEEGFDGVEDAEGGAEDIEGGAEENVEGDVVAGDSPEGDETDQLVAQGDRTVVFV